MKLAVAAPTLLATLSPFVAGQASIANVIFYALTPDTVVAAFPGCNESLVTSEFFSTALEIRPNNIGDNVQCTFYKESGCSGEGFTYGPGYHNLDDHPLIPSFSCEAV